MKSNLAGAVAALLLIIADMPALAQTPAAPAGDSLEATYVLCIRRTAVRLEPSEEPAETIARAAAALCTKEGVTLFNHLIGQPGQRVDPAKLQTDAQFFAVADVVAARLCRKTRDCTVGPRP